MPFPASCSTPSLRIIMQIIVFFIRFSSFFLTVPKAPFFGSRYFFSAWHTFRLIRVMTEKKRKIKGKSIVDLPWICADTLYFKKSYWNSPVSFHNDNGISSKRATGCHLYRSGPIALCRCLSTGLPFSLFSCLKSVWVYIRILYLSISFLLNRNNSLCTLGTKKQAAFHIRTACCCGSPCLSTVKYHVIRCLSE